MKLFIVGDHRTGTGPANVTKEYIANCPDNVMYQKKTGKLARVPELLWKIICCDTVLFSGYSRQNLLGIGAAHMLGRKTAYLMHGCVAYENAINGVPDETMNDCERRTLEGCDAIYAVSGRFAEWLKAQYPEYAHKIDYVINGVDGIKAPMQVAAENVQDRSGVSNIGRMIFSIGGGMPRKKIKHICEAVKRLNDQGYNLTMTVVGDNGLDDEAINAYPFVKNLGLVGHDRVAKLFEEADLFVQNSCFETFGLAPVEALSLNCSVLLSDKIGALDIIETAEESDIIYDYKNADEIAEKIKGILDRPNADRLAAGIDFDKYSWSERGKVLWEKLIQLQN